MSTKQTGITTYLNIQFYHKATVIKTGWYWHKSIHKQKVQDRNPKNNTTHLQSTDSQHRCQEKDSFFNKWCWENWKSHTQNNKTRQSCAIIKNQLKVDQQPKCIKL
jgi:hypothetical protein